MFTRLFAALMLFGVWAGSAQATTTLVLSPHNDGSAAGYGYKGLYLAGDFSGGISCAGYTGSQLTHPCTNWTWDNVSMQIDNASGDATISGTMTRDLNHEVWGLTVMLQDAEIKHAGGLYEDGGNYSGPISPEMLTALSNGIDPITGQDNSGVGEWGLEWKTLSITLNKMGNSSSVPETGWQGYAMPDMGHIFVAELHYDGPQHGLTLDAWYKNPHTSSWYDVGDSKLQAALLDPGPTSGVPEPGTLVVFAFGVAGVAAARRRKRVKS